MKFRKRPVVIEAILVREALQDWRANPGWLREAYEKGNVLFGNNNVVLRTLESQHFTADFDDWIIQGVKGEIYACKPDIFAATYQQVFDEEGVLQALASTAEAVNDNGGKV